MQSAGSTFTKRASIAIHDPRLQAALANASGGFVHKRALQVSALAGVRGLARTGP